MRLSRMTHSYRVTFPFCGTPHRLLFPGHIHRRPAFSCMATADTAGPFGPEAGHKRHACKGDAGDRSPYNLVYRLERLRNSRRHNIAIAVRGFVCSLLIMGISHLTRAQTKTAVPLTPSENIQIARLADNNTLFPNILTDGSSKAMYDNAFVISNHDKRDVAAIYAVWKITDQSGKTYTREYLSDVYIALVPTLVIPSGKALIITPNGWIFPQRYNASQALAEAQSPPYLRLESRLTLATNISLSVDAVTFTDGETCGANVKRLDKVLLSRRAAGTAIVADIRASLARSEDWVPLLTKKYASRGGEDTSTEEFWQLSIFSHLSQVHSDPQQLQSLLTYYESLPQPPPFIPCRT